MKTLTFPGPAYMPRLLPELEALPFLAPVPSTAMPGMLEAVFTIGRAPDGAVMLVVPDTADEAAIDAVIAAHDPTPPPPIPVPDYGADPADLDQQAAQVVSALRAYIGAASPTQAQTVSAVKLLCRVALYLVKRQLA